MHRICLLPLLLLAACTWVALEPSAEDVMTLSAGEVGHCERIGKATARSMHKLGFVERNEDKVAGELNTLARNEAFNLGGNAIVPETGITQGRQQFGVYRCPE